MKVQRHSGSSVSGCRARSKCICWAFTLCRSFPPSEASTALLPFYVNEDAEGQEATVLAQGHSSYWRNLDSNPYCWSLKTTPRWLWEHWGMRNAFGDPQVSRQRSSRSLSGNTLQPNSLCTQEGGRSFDLSMMFCILPSVFTIWNSIFTCIYIWSMSFPLYAKLCDRKDRIELSWQSGLCLNMC